MSQIDLDKVTNASSGEVAQGAMSILDHAQHLPKHVQLMALAAAFLALSARLKVEPQDIFTYIKNLVIYCKDTPSRPEFRALDDYLEGEL